ncbi:MAG: hypothetical protein HQM09_20510 [Candidatus Riflebacteria bacterium]|nr:hypothetical protein [Candidatus Riflebacteria bacterium]
MTNLVKITMFFALMHIFAGSAMGSSITFSPDPSVKDQTVAFNKAVLKLKESDADTLSIPPGKYYFSGADGKENAALCVEGLKGKKIVGRDAVFLFGRADLGGICFRNNENLLVQGIRIDWDPLPFAQGIIRNVSKFSGTIDIEIMRELPTPDMGTFQRAPVLWATVHHADGRRYLDSHDVIHLSGFQQLDQKTIRLSLKNRGAVMREGMKTGNVLVVVARYPTAHAIRVFNSSSVTITDNEIMSSPGMGIIVGPRCKDVFVRNNRLAHSTPSASFISLNADGIHVIEPLGQLVIEGNTLDSLQDDAVIVSRRGEWAHYDAATKSFLFDSTSPTVIFSAGEKAEALAPNAGLVTLGAVRTSEKSAGGGVRIVAEKGLDVADRSRMPVFPVPSETARVSIRNNQIINIRGVGIRINFPNVSVEGNRVIDVIGISVRLGCSVNRQWEPQYPAVNTTVSSNVIRGFDVSSGRKPLPFGMIDVSCYPPEEGALYGKSSSGITIVNNIFEGGLGFMSKKINVISARDATVQ